MYVERMFCVALCFYPWPIELVAQELPSEVTAIREVVRGQPNDVGVQGENTRPSDSSDAHIVVDLDLSVSHAYLTVGEDWMVDGIVTNRSTQPVWIVDTATSLTPPLEVWSGEDGRSSAGVLGAVFPTTPNRDHEVVKLHPGADYAVFWPLQFGKPGGSSEEDILTALEQLIAEEAATEEGTDNSPIDSEDDQQADQGLLDRVGKTRFGKALAQRLSSSFAGHFFFVPGKYNMIATMHVWSEDPNHRLESIGELDFSNSTTITSQKEFHIAAPPEVLAFGAAIGGLLCFILRLVSGYYGDSQRHTFGLTFVLVGSFTAVLLCSIVTILGYRLVGTILPIELTVYDVWGAVATGFIIQWYGLPYLVGKMAKLPDIGAHKVDGNNGGQEPAAGAGADNPVPDAEPVDVQAPK